MKKLAYIILLAGFLLLGLGAYSRPAFIGDSSDHFDGRKFYNLKVRESRHYFQVIKGFLTGDIVLGHWEKKTNKSYADPVERVFGDKLKVTFINHSTVLVQTQGVNILTDPIWSDYCGPVAVLAPKRYRQPGIALQDLPPIDLVVISHSHYDHMDIPSLQQLQQHFNPVFLVGLGNKPLLKAAGIDKVVELDWWQPYPLSDSLTVWGTPAQHWSRRGLFDQNKRLWMSYVFETQGGPIFFAGDTAMAKHFQLIKDRFGPLRLSLLPIGAFKPEIFMRGSHLSPRQAVEAHEILQSEHSIAIHFGTFRLGLDSQDDPLEELALALKEKPLDDSIFTALDFGESLYLNETRTVSSHAVARGE